MMDDDEEVLVINHQMPGLDNRRPRGNGTRINVIYTAALYYAFIAVVCSTIVVVIV